MPSEDETWLGEALAAASATFRDEAVELIAELTRTLIALEGADRQTECPALYERLLRSLHTLKGSAGMVGISSVRALTHELETLILEASKDPPEAPGWLVNAALAALDAAQGWIDRSSRREAIGADEIVAAVAALSEAVAARAPSRERPRLSPAPDPTSTRRPSTAAPSAWVSPEPSFLRVSTEKVDQVLVAAEELLTAGTQLAPRVAALTSIVDQVQQLQRDLTRARRACQRSARAAGGVTPDLAAEVLDTAVSDLNRIHRRLASAAWDLTGDAERTGALAHGLLGELREVRMLPAATLFETFRRPVRDLAAEYGRSVRLVVNGGEIRLDKRVLDQLKQPLVHLLRNTVAHGVELPEERRAAGKPPTATVTVGAEQRGNRVVVTVSDDGRGIDPERVRAVALRGGLLDAQRTGALSTEEVHELLFAPGFSTHGETSQVAGRGVGLSVGRVVAVGLTGVVTSASGLGQGCAFHVAVRLTVATSSGLLVRVGRELYALPVPMIERLARLPASEVRELQGLSTIELSGAPLRLLSLSQVISGDPAPAPASGEMISAVVLASGRRRAAFWVTEVVGKLEIIMRELPPPLAGIGLLAGATTLDDGRVVLVLNAEGLLREAAAPASRSSHVSSAPHPSPRAERGGCIIVADDSATTRMLMASELEAAGFRVRTASDGAGALALLSSGAADALVSDVAMPNLDGFELTRQVRASVGLRGLPIVLVTSRDSSEDRSRGAEVGADAYLIKKDFDRSSLLDTLDRLMRRKALQ